MKIRKSFCRGLVLIGLLLMTFPVYSFEYTYMGNTLEYTVLSDGTVSVKKGSVAPQGALVIPASVTDGNKTYSVTRVVARAFEEKAPLVTSLELPATMKVLEHHCFRSCANLAQITLNEGLTTIANRAFCNDSALTTVTIPSTVTSIEEMAFGNLTRLATLTMKPASCPTMTSNAFGFWQATSLVKYRRVIVPCGKYDKYSQCISVFRGGSSIVFLKEECDGNVEEPFTDGKFYYTPMTQTKTLKLIGYVSGAVAGRLVIPESTNYNGEQWSIVAVGSSAFDGNKKMTSLVLPSSIKSIESRAFRSCINLTQIVLNEGLTTIENRAFCNDSALTVVTIPSTVTYMGDYAFGNALRLRTMNCLAPNPPEIEEMGNGYGYIFRLYEATDKVQRTVYVPCGAEDAYKVAGGWDNENLNIVGCPSVEVYHHSYPLAEQLTTEYAGGETINQIEVFRIFTAGKWESVCIPFDVDKIVVYDNDNEEELKPWKSGVGGNFWLCARSGATEEGEPVFEPSDKLEANTPYLIQFKHDWYNNKPIIFCSAYGKKVFSNPDFKQETTGGDMFVNNTMKKQTISKAYLLENNEFVLHEGEVTLYPFECYIPTWKETAAQVRRFAVHYNEHSVTTDNAIAPQISGTEMLCTVSGNTLTIQTNGEAVSIYSVNGMLLQAFPAGTETATINLESGYYIVASEHGSQRVVL